MNRSTQDNALGRYNRRRGETTPEACWVRAGMRFVFGKTGAVFVCVYMEGSIVHLRQAGDTSLRTRSVHFNTTAFHVQRADGASCASGYTCMETINAEETCHG